VLVSVRQRFEKANEKETFLSISIFLMVTSSLVVASLGLAVSGDWLLRLRSLHRSPNDDSDSISIITRPIASDGSDTTVELDFTYFISRSSQVFINQIAINF